MDNLYNTVLERLNEQGVTIANISQIALDNQSRWLPDLNLVDVMETTEGILHRRDVLNALLTALEMDRLSSEGMFQEPLQSILKADSAGYGVDEMLALGICSTGGPIAYTTYGQLDIEKPGIIGKLNSRPYTVFIDDAIGAVVGVVENEILHKSQHYEWE